MIAILNLQIFGIELVKEMQIGMLLIHAKEF
jgi:hypothetical protein